MATTNIDNNEPTATVCLPELLVCLERLITEGKRNQIALANTEIQLLNTLLHGTVTGSGTVSGIVVTYT